MQIIGLVFGLIVLIGSVWFWHICNYYPGKIFDMRAGGVRLHMIGKGKIN